MASLDPHTLLGDLKDAYTSYTRSKGETPKALVMSSVTYNALASAVYGNSNQSREDSSQSGNPFSIMGMAVLIHERSKDGSILLLSGQDMDRTNISSMISDFTALPTLANPDEERADTPLCPFCGGECSCSWMEGLPSLAGDQPCPVCMGSGHWDFPRNRQVSYHVIEERDSIVELQPGHATNVSDFLYKMSEVANKYKKVAYCKNINGEEMAIEPDASTDEIVAFIKSYFSLIKKPFKMPVLTPEKGGPISPFRTKRRRLME